MACAQVSPGHLLSCCPRLMKVWVPRRALAGTPCRSSAAPKTPVFPEPSLGHGGALPSHTRASQFNFMCSLRFSSLGKPLEGGEAERRRSMKKSSLVCSTSTRSLNRLSCSCKRRILSSKCCGDIYGVTQGRTRLK